MGHTHWGAFDKNVGLLTMSIISERQSILDQSESLYIPYIDSGS
jgi:hypothetical protein